MASLSSSSSSSFPPINPNSIAQKIADLEVEIKEYKRELKDLKDCKKAATDPAEIEKRIENKEAIILTKENLLYRLFDEKSREEQGGAAQQDVKTLMKEAIRETATEDKESTIVISNANTAAVCSLYQRVGFVNVMIDPPNDMPIDAFDWGDFNEVNGTPLARILMDKWLTDNVPQFADHFKLEDTHASRSILNFQDDRIGNISGGTDMVIVPRQTAQTSFPQEICVVFELKTEKQVAAKGLRSFANSAMTEFVAANCLSYQPAVMTILTDLSSSAIIWCAEWKSNDNDTSGGKVTVTECDATIGQMASMLHSFLMTKPVREPDFIPNPRNDPRGERFYAMKRKQTDISDQISRFETLADGTAEWSKERAAATWDFMQNCGFKKMPALVQHTMYS